MKSNFKLSNKYNLFKLFTTSNSSFANASYNSKISKTFFTIYTNNKHNTKNTFTTIKNQQNFNINLYKQLYKPFSMTNSDFLSKLSPDDQMNETLFDGIISKIRLSIDNKKPISNNSICEALGLYFLSRNTNLKNEFLLIMDIYFLDKNNMMTLNENQLPKFLEYICRFKLDDNKSKVLDECLEFKIQSDKVSTRTKLFIFESLYYFTLHNVKLEKTTESVLTFIENNIYKFNNSDASELLRTCLFYSLQFLAKISPILCQYMLDISKEPNKNLRQIQFFPKLLSTLDINKANEFKILITNYFKTYEQDSLKFSGQADVLVCILTNIVTYIGLEQNVFEIFIPFIYRNLSNLPGEFVNELFFTVLKYDGKQYKDLRRIEFLMRDCLLIIKSSKDFAKEVEKSPEIKESRYVIEQGKKLRECYKLWKIEVQENHMKEMKNGGNVSTNIIEEKYEVLFDQVVNKNFNVYPFSCIQCNTKLFDIMFQNFRLLIKLN